MRLPVSLTLSLALPAAVLLSGCMSEGSGPSLPEDFVPGGVYGLSRTECAAQAGTWTTDGNGLAFCSLGAADAVFACDGGGFVSLMRRAGDKAVIITPSGKLHSVVQRPAASGVLLEGADVALHEKARQAILTEGGQDTACELVR
ncbi:MAG TPA: hypothetical protein PLH11_06215 [Gemmobacter sp.]|nr:hypothetical protein [Gemmobacter sp.]